MKHLTFAFCLIVCVLSASQAKADEELARAAEGTYFLIQEDGFQRLLQLNGNGNASQASNQQMVLGFTSGLGTWKRIGHKAITARIIDFDFDLSDGLPSGATRVTYVITFSDVVHGKFQAAKGFLVGETFGPDQNPLDPTERPTFRFRIGFTGQRVPPPGDLNP
jgi:hypothetical protein